MNNTLDQIWTDREQQHYPRIFGALEEGMYPLGTELFAQSFPRKEFKPEWLEYGVMVSPPNARRNSWLYVSSGLSNPWDSEAAEAGEDEYSGLGFEWVMETREHADWAVFQVQRMMAYSLLLAHGQLSDIPAPTFDDLVRVGQPLDFSEEGLLRHLLILQPQHYSDTFRLFSGHVDFQHLLGITENEYMLGVQSGGEALRKQLQEDEAGMVTVFAK